MAAAIYCIPTHIMYLLFQNALHLQTVQMEVSITNAMPISVNAPAQMYWMVTSAQVCCHLKEKMYTGGHKSSYPWFSGKQFDCFNQLIQRIHRQMVSHLKALIISFQNQVRYLAWHHSEGSHALLTEKAPLPVKLVWSVSQQKFFQF